MASLSTPSPSGNSMLSSSSFTSSSSLLSSAKPCQILINIKRNQRFKVSCEAAGGDRSPKDEDITSGKLHRRNMVLGLGGLYGAANLVGDHLASAEPIHFPDVTKRGTAYIPIRDGGSQPVPYSCCPPVPTTEIKKYELPKNPVMRIRPAAHLVDDKFVEKYAAAIDAMKKLNDDHPHSFYQQANIHCAYCNSAYKQDQGDFSPPIQVHGSWLFLPFHRWYLYFFESILGKLIDDPTFSLPYWNWDAPCGMTLPYLFNDPNSALFDPKRNQAHLPPKAIDLGFDGTDHDIPDVQLVCNNLSIIYRQLVTNATNPADFIGRPYRLGNSSLQDGAGSIEAMPHATRHRWVGDPRESFRENMGNFYSAAKDPIFYSHHATVDRIWAIWKTIGGRRDDFQDLDWKQALFFFYDENAQPVYVTVEDCLTTEAMGYTYQPMELPWLRARPMPRKKKPDIVRTSGARTVPNVFPTTREKEVKVLVQRPKKSRTKEKKDQKEELLIFEGIEFPLDKYVKFDVFINDEDDKSVLTDKAEYAGSFTHLPHAHDHSNAQILTASLRLGLNEILEDLESEGEEFILVTTVPKSEGDSVKVDNIRIDYA